MNFDGEIKCAIESKFRKLYMAGVFSPEGLVKIVAREYSELVTHLPSWQFEYDNFRNNKSLFANSQDLLKICAQCSTFLSESAFGSTKWYAYSGSIPSFVQRLQAPFPARLFCEPGFERTSAFNSFFKAATKF